MASRPFKQVDVFTSAAYLGNPVAVVLDGTGLSDASMQSFARWTQLSETTFVLPPSPEAKAQGADYKLRIFTPGGELPFAGHPTLGSASAWLKAGGQAQQAGVLVQECGVGLVRLEMREGRWAFAAPPVQMRSMPEATLPALLKALGLQTNQVMDSQILNNGPEWWAFLLDDVETVRNLAPDHLALKQLGVKVGVAAKTEQKNISSPLLISRSNRESRAFAGKSLRNEATDKPDAQLEVRAFAAAIGITEDPVTGSLNASLSQWLIGSGEMPTDYVASQGSALGREGRVHIQQDTQGQVWVGGDTVICIEGHVALD
ncbi:MAG: Trans-2,3-dihydro-3-hydroxyanthranilate isomerase [Pseudomonadota bacterium]|jgi:PhzF family phenazine biosynthesis protein